MGFIGYHQKQQTLVMSEFNHMQCLGLLGVEEMHTPRMCPLGVGGMPHFYALRDTMATFSVKSSFGVMFFLLANFGDHIHFFAWSLCMYWKDIDGGLPFTKLKHWELQR